MRVQKDAERKANQASRRKRDEEAKEQQRLADEQKVKDEGVDQVEYKEQEQMIIEDVVSIMREDGHIDQVPLKQMSEEDERVPLIAPTGSEDEESVPLISPQ